jgi:hypothetical protein
MGASILADPRDSAVIAVVMTIGTSDDLGADRLSGGEGQ